MAIREQLSRYCDSLRARGSGNPIPVRARFSAPGQTEPGAHPFSYTMSNVSLPRIMQPKRVSDHTPPSTAEVERRVELYICCPSGTSGLFLS
jgi:hypothetical protein